MTAPAFPWIQLTDGELTSGMPIPGTLPMAIRNRLEHLREIVYDPDTMTAAVAHDHDGVNSGLIWWPSPNLIPGASLNRSTLGFGQSDWEAKNSVTTDQYSLTGGAFLNAEGEYLYTALGGGDNSSRDDLQSDEAFGGGAPMVVSIYAKVKSTAGPPINEGAIAFGLASGSTADFLPGCKGLIDWTDLATTHKRFWLRCKIGDVSDPVGMLIKCTEKSDAPMVLDCPMVTLGTSLSYWMPMPNDDTHRNMLKVSTFVPIWDEMKSITSAIRVPAR